MLRSVKMVAMAMALTAVVAACDDDDDPIGPPDGDETTWVAELDSEGEAEVTGSATVEVDDESSAAQIEIAGGVDEAEYEWYIGEGATCEDDATRLGDVEDYEVLVADDDGEATGDAEVSDLLDDEDEYHVAVRSMDDDALVACGELQVED